MKMDQNGENNMMFGFEEQEEQEAREKLRIENQ